MAAKTTKTRRGRGEGSIRYLESKKLYEARYPVGKDPETGKPLYKSIYDKKKKVALQLMRDALQALGKGEYVDPSDKPLYTWCNEWYELYKEPTLKRLNTKSNYELSLKRIKKYTFARVALKDLTPEIMQTGYNDMHKKYASGTILITNALINGALDKAEQLNMIAKNPLRQVIIPQDMDTDTVKALTDDQLDRFLSQLGKRSHYYMFGLFLVNTGLRSGEGAALDRQDFNPDTKTVKVHKTCLPPKRVIQYDTKTKSSIRTVPIPSTVVMLLKAYMLRQPNKADNAPLFQTLRGTRLTMRNVAQQFAVIGESIGCDWVTPHTLRHTFASRLFAKGVDIKVISALLGHKKVSTTYDLYIHFISDVKTDSVQLLNDGLPDTLPKKSWKKQNNIKLMGT